jgi:hypothetical protein
MIDNDKSRKSLFLKQFPLMMIYELKDKEKIKFEHMYLDGFNEHRLKRKQFLCVPQLGQKSQFFSK